jgi:hypothetical protein
VEDNNGTPEIKTDESISPAKDSSWVQEVFTGVPTQEELEARQQFDSLAPEPRRNPFKDWRLYLTYVITVALPGIAMLLPGGEDYGAAIFLLIGVIFVYPIIGLAVWAAIRVQHRSVALGILLGGVTPFIITFVMTGGCGLFDFELY